MALYVVQQGQSTPADAVGCTVKIDREYPGSSYVHVKDIHSKRGWYVFRADLLPHKLTMSSTWPRLLDFPWLFTEEVFTFRNTFSADTMYKTIARPGGLKPKPFSVEYMAAFTKDLPADQVVFIGGPSHGRVERHDNRPLLCAYSLLRDRAIFATDFDKVPEMSATGVIHTYHRLKDGRAVHEAVMRLYPANVQAGYHFT